VRRDSGAAATVLNPLKLGRFFRSLPDSRPPFFNGIRDSLSCSLAHDTFLLAFLRGCLGSAGGAHTALIELAQDSYSFIDSFLLGF
jgi:hypothetical protein